MTNHPAELAREKAIDIIGGCTCDFEKGFAWDGVHKSSCIVDRIAQVLLKQRDDVLEEAAKVAEKDICEGDNDFGAWRNICNERIAKVIRQLKSKQEKSNGE